MRFHVLEAVIRQLRMKVMGRKDFPTLTETRASSGSEEVIVHRSLGRSCLARGGWLLVRGGSEILRL